MERIDKVKGVFERKLRNEASVSGVPAAVIRRLPRYHRYLGDLLQKGTLRISSAELSSLMRVTASQIRQDLNCFGGFGQQGYGYNVKYLHQKIGELLGVEAGFSAVLLGAGNLGRALASSNMFERRGVKLLCMFDVDEHLIGKEIAGLPVLSVDELESYCKENQVTVGVLTTPKTVAEDMAKRLHSAGVKGIWNFSNTELGLFDSSMIVENIHLGDSLMRLCFEIKSEGEMAE